MRSSARSPAVSFGSPSARPSSRRRLSFLLALPAVLLLAGCGAEDGGPVDPSPDPEVSVSASFTAEPREPRVGEEVTLDGTASSVQNAGQPSYQWQLDAPSGSDAEVEEPTAEVTTFVPDATGSYEVTLQVSAEGVSDAATDDLDAVEPVEEISADITEDRTLHADVLYRVTGEISVTAALTIEPGTRIEFEESTGFTFDSGSTVVAEGSGDAPIVFTGTRESAGWWDGLWIRSSESTLNTIEHTVVEYGGNEAFHGSTEPANVVVAYTNGDAEVTLANTVVRHGGGHGIFVHRNGDLPGFAQNEITDNAGPAVRVMANRVHRLDAASSFTGNGDDFVDVVGDTGAEVDGDATWESLDVPYRMDGETDVDGAALTIEPGAELAFRQGARLDVETNGALVAEGTEADSVVFTGTQETAGWWGGIFVQSDHPNNRLDHAVVAYGGSEALHSSTEAANLTVGRTLRDAQVTIANSNLRHGGRYGLFVHLNGDIPGFSENVITENHDPPVHIRSHHAHHLDGASDYSGNGETISNEDWVEVEGGTGAEIDREDVTWEDLTHSYIISGDVRVEGVVLTIEEGASLRFRQGAGLEVRSNGALVAVSPGDNPSEDVTFYGDETESGWWKGIFIRSDNPQNRLEGVRIRRGGSEAWHSSTEPANLTVARTLYDGQVEVRNSLLAESDGWGIWVHGNGAVNADICDVNDFPGSPVDNEAGDCHIE